MVNTVHMSQEHNGKYCPHVSGTQWPTLHVHLSQEHSDQHCSHLRNTMINTVHISGAQWSTLFASQEHNDQHCSHVSGTQSLTVITWFTCLSITIYAVHMSGIQWLTLFICLRNNDLCCSHVRNTVINIVHMPQEHWSTRHSLQMKEPWCLLPEILDLSLKWVWQFLKVLFIFIFQLCCQEASLLQRECVIVPCTTIYTFMPVITG